jgi:phospholipase C
MRSRSWIRPLPLAALLSALLIWPSAGAARQLDQINYVVVIYQENHSFDNYFGMFPGADGIANAEAAAVQADRAGQPYRTLPQPLDLVDGGRTPDPRFPSDLPNGPFLINPYVAPTEQIDPMLHLFYRHQYQINGGQMDRFVAWTDAAGMVMGYWDTSSLPIWQLASEYTLADHFFQGAFGGSFLNHQWLICACTPVFPSAPPQMYSVPDPNDPEHLQDKNLTPDGFVVNTSFSVNAPHPGDVARETLVPNQTAPTIGDRLSDAGVSWAWYSGGWDDALAGHPDPLFQFHHQPFVYYANYADGTPAKAEHLQDEARFLGALQDGTLPHVSFVKPLGPENEHPNYTTVVRGQDHLGQLVQAIQASPYWPETAIIITYDEYGGAWDHVPPPAGDRFGPGTRVPAVIVSPFAKRGFVDHTTYDTTSILRFIETRWGLPALAQRDAASGDLHNAFE